MNDPFEALAAMKVALEEGLALLDGASVDDTAGLDALARVTASIVAVPNPATLRAAVPAERLEEFDDQLEELLRLNASETCAFRACVAASHTPRLHWWSPTHSAERVHSKCHRCVTQTTTGRRSSSSRRECRNPIETLPYLLA